MAYDNVPKLWKNNEILSTKDWTKIQSWIEAEELAVVINDVAITISFFGKISNAKTKDSGKWEEIEKTKDAPETIVVPLDCKLGKLLKILLAETSPEKRYKGTVNLDSLNNAIQADWILNGKDDRGQSLDSRMISLLGGSWVNIGETPTKRITSIEAKKPTDSNFIKSGKGYSKGQTELEKLDDKYALIKRCLLEDADFVESLKNKTNPTFPEIISKLEVSSVEFFELLFSNSISKKN